MRQRERGEGKLGLILFLAAVAIGVFVAFKVVPPRVNAYEFRDYIEEICKKAPYDRSSPESITRDLLLKAKELKLPVEEKDIKVEKTGEAATVTCVVTVPIDLKVYTYILKVDCSSSSKAVA